MTDNTRILWTHYFGSNTGATWNPFIAINKSTGEIGNVCVRYNTDCKYCYAAYMNKTRPYNRGTGLDYTYGNLNEVEMRLSKTGQTSIFWPIKTKKPHGIFPCSMTEWISEFTPEWITDSIFEVMLKADHHVYFPLTKRVWKMTEYLLKKFKTINIPKHIIFGVTIGSQNVAYQHMAEMMALKIKHPSVKLWVSYEPATTLVNWNPLKDVIDWLVMGGESKQGEDEPRPLREYMVIETRDWCEKNNIPFFFKQWNDKKIPPLIDGKLYQQFPILQPTIKGQ